MAPPPTESGKIIFIEAPSSGYAARVQIDNGPVIEYGPVIDSVRPIEEGWNKAHAAMAAGHHVKFTILAPGLEPSR